MFNFNKKSFIFFLKLGILIVFTVFISRFGFMFVTGELQIVSSDYLNETNQKASIIPLKKLSETREDKETETDEIKTNTISGEITIGWVGDVPPSIAIPKFSNTVIDYLNANDLTAGNLEGVLSDNQKSTKCKVASKHCFSFVGDNKFAQSLSEAGFDILNLANNHIFDKGNVGVEETKSILSFNNLFYSPENGNITVKNINSIDVAFVSFGHNPWTKKIIDVSNVETIIRNATSKYPIVIVFFHGGAEGENNMRVIRKNEHYLGENRGDVYKFAHTAIDAGADLVLGSGPHVVRGIEKYNDRLIIYSAGNFLTTKGIMSKGLLGKSAIFNITINQEGVYKNLSIISTDSELKDVVSKDSSNSALNKIIELTKQDFGQAITTDSAGNVTFI